MANQNPHAAPFLSPEMVTTLSSIRRLDKDGYLYEMDCSWDYYDPRVREFLTRFGLFKAGCSVFVTESDKGGSFTCRNYDYKHRRFNKETEPATALNLILHCAPEGKYRSVGVSDVYWLDGAGGTFYNGTLDDGKTDISYVVLLPYACMDGMNEKGLTVSILSQPIRPGEVGVSQEEPGKAKVTHTVMMRYMLDSCADIKEAVSLARSVNVVSPNGADYRIFITDATGASVALEWRYNKLYEVYTNISTNFYVGFDDCEDRKSKEGVLLERAIKLGGASREYHYGYGGGYQRFAALLSQLEMARDLKSETYRTVMNARRADIVIQTVIRGIGPEATSATQYSAVYDQKALKLYLRETPSFAKRYCIKL